MNIIEMTGKIQWDINSNERRQEQDREKNWAGRNNSEMTKELWQVKFPYSTVVRKEQEWYSNRNRYVRILYTVKDKVHRKALKIIMQTGIDMNV